MKKTVHLFPLSAAALALLLSACASNVPLSTTLEVPAALQAPINERIAFTWRAVGTQNYECRASSQGVLAWTLVAPDAQLFNGAKQKAGSHGVGPHWQALDGSRTVGTVAARADAPNPRADIPWLLLSAQPDGGAGVMRAVTHIQRIHTEGGVAPQDGCAGVADVGKTARQPYTADYVFYVK